jgi:hypothetical protein
MDDLDVVGHVEPLVVMCDKHHHAILNKYIPMAPIGRVAESDAQQLAGPRGLPGRDVHQHT